MVAALGRPYTVEQTNLTGAALVAAHKEMVRKARVLTLVFPLVLILIVVANLTAIGNQFKNLDTTAIGDDLTQRAGSLMPEMEGYLSDVASAALPALTSALEQESAAMAPLVQQRLQMDMEQLMETARADFRVRADEALESVREKQREALVAAYPALANDRVGQDQVLTAAHDAMVLWATNRFNAAVKEHMSALDDIRKTLEKSYSAPAGQVAAPEDALMAWLELLNERVGARTGEPEHTATGPVGRAVTEEPQAE